MKKKIHFLLLLLFFFILPTYAETACPDLNKLLNPKFPTKINDISKYQSQTILIDDALTTTCDQQAFLKKLFHEVTKHEDITINKVKAWSTFLQRSLYHSCYPPIDSNSQAIYSPIWILKNQGVHCGQAARLAVDGFLAAGFKARLVQLNSHVVAEVWVSGKYRMIDIDALDTADFIYDHQGEIASVGDIFEDKTLVYLKPAYNKQKHYPNCTKSPSLPKNYSDFFSKETYGAFSTPFIYEKDASPSQLKNIYFGWNYYQTKPYHNTY